MSKRKLVDYNHSSDEEQFLPPQCKRPRLEKIVASKKKPFRITDVPVDCLFHVFSKVNIWHHNRIRATCKHFLMAHNQYLDHKLLKASNEFKNKNDDENNVSAAILTSIKQATQIYVNAGYDSVMYNCLMPLVLQTYHTPFDFKSQNIRKFLETFFASVDKRMANPGSHQALMLYMMTMLNLLKSFRNFEFTATEQGPYLWLTVVVPNMWVSAAYGRSVAGREKNNAILVILSSLLVGNISMQALKYILQLGNEFFLFGSGAAGRSQYAKTEFKISIKGSEKVRAFFKKWIRYPKNQDIELPSNLDAEKFQFEVAIACESATDWGCPPTMIFHIESRSFQYF